MLKPIVTLIVIGFVLLVLLKLLKQAISASKGELPYVRKDYLLTKAERSFFGVLKGALGGKFEIFGQVRVADVLGIRKGLGKSDRQSAFNRIKAKHVDFVLCDPGNLKIVAAIELDDSSHNDPKRIERDNFLNQAFQNAGLPLIRIPAKASYSSLELLDLIQKAVCGESAEPQVVESPVEGNERPVAAIAESPTCPKCSSVMVKRKATKGKHAGTFFWACSAYPTCKTIAPIKSGD